MLFRTVNKIDMTVIYTDGPVEGSIIYIPSSPEEFTQNYITWRVYMPRIISRFGYCTYQGDILN